MFTQTNIPSGEVYMDYLKWGTINGLRTFQGKLPAYSIQADDDVIEAKFLFPNRKAQTKDNSAASTV